MASSGSAARKYVEAPVYESRREREQKEHSEAVRRNREKAFHISGRYMVFLTVACILSVVICVLYLSLQSGVISKAARVNELQQEISELREANDAKYNNAKDSINIDEVKQEAIEEYGMVYASPDQVITYPDPQGDYMKQYGEIPDSGISGD